MTALKTARKPSRVYEDLAWMIVLPKHPMASMVLRYLSRMAGDSGTCFPGFALISAVCNGASNSSIAEALAFLYSLGLLSLTRKGHGNQHSFYNKSNVYQLNADAMLRLVTAQEVFAPERKGACLFKGMAKELADKVKSLTLTPAELSDRFAKYDGRAAELSERPAGYDHRLAELSETTLTLIEPCIEPQVQQPPIEPAPAIPSLGEIAPVGMGVDNQTGVSQCDPPLSSPTLLSRNDPPNWRNQPTQYFSDIVD